MTTSNSNRHASNTDDTIAGAGNSHRIRTLVVQEYPSLAGTDDELLPSGD